MTILESGHITLEIELAKRLNFYFENLCLWFIDLIGSLPIGLIMVRDSVTTVIDFRTLRYQKLSPVINLNLFEGLLNSAEHYVLFPKSPDSK